MTLSEKQRLFAVLWSQLVTWAYDHGYEMVMGEALRTKEQQQRYVDSGASKTLNSLHLVSCAQDFSLFVGGEWVVALDKPNLAIIDGHYTTDPELYRPLGEHWETLGTPYGVTTRWGGRFGVEPKDYGTKVGWDAGHVELL